MRYTQADRKAINSLNAHQRNLFDAIEQQEQGEFVAVPEMCAAIESSPNLIIFSCLSGDGSKQELDLSLGTLFETKLKRLTEKFSNQLIDIGHDLPITVLLDDCEPKRVWQWSTPQAEITAWCRMVIEDSSEIPSNWTVRPWSDLEQGTNLTFEESVQVITHSKHALLVHQHQEHMKKFPNKKLIGNLRDAALRRVAGYALQGVVLEQQIPSAILCQSETPWEVKEPIYNPFRDSPLPIIHPYPERR
jgi:hypothetical protein